MKMYLMNIDNQEAFIIRANNVNDMMYAYFNIAYTKEANKKIRDEIETNNISNNTNHYIDKFYSEVLGNIIEIGFNDNELVSNISIGTTTDIYEYSELDIEVRGDKVKTKAIELIF